MQYALLFEAQSIQRYLLDSGRLRDTVGASELVAGLTETLLPAVLEEVDGADRIHFSRKRGGAFYAFCETAEPLQVLAALLTLALPHHAPGLHCALGMGRGDTHVHAFDDARKALNADQNRPRPALPLAPPVAARAPRTGLGAVEVDRHKEEDWIDAATRRKRQAGIVANRGGVASRFLPEGSGPGRSHWPVDLEAGSDAAFPFSGEDRGIALIHIDGNNLGVLLRQVREACLAGTANYIEAFSAFSEGIAAATERAARHATTKVLLAERSNREGAHEGSMLAARPIVLGGDDVTLLIRSDLAIDFVRAFVAAFEQESRVAMQGLAALGVEDVPAYLTVGAGIVFLQASQPFHLATELAESLTGAAKQAARHLGSGTTPQPSTLAFLRITGTLSNDLEQTLEHEHRVAWGGEVFHDRLDAYAFGPAAGLPCLGDLLALHALLAAPDMARGPLRQLLGLLGEAPDDAARRYRRWRQMVNEKTGLQLREFDAVLERLAGGATAHERLPYARIHDEWHSPLGDAIALRAIKTPVSPVEKPDLEDATA